MPDSIMDDLAAITAAGTVLELGGRSYLVRPLTLQDIATLRQWVADQVDKLPSPLRHLAGDLEGIPADLRARLADQAFEAARTRREFTSPEAQAILGGTGGTAMILWLSVRGSHPDVSLDFLRGQVESSGLEAVKEMLTVVNRINGWMAPEGNRGGRSMAPTPSTGETFADISASTG